MFRDRALAIERVDGSIVLFSDSISSSFGTAVISFDFTSVAIRRYQALLATPSADHVPGRLSAGFVTTAKHFAVYRDNTLTLVENFVMKP